MKKRRSFERRFCFSRREEESLLNFFHRLGRRTLGGDLGDRHTNRRYRIGSASER
jgi:hypothetical protein